MLPKVSNGEPESGERHFMYLFIVYRGKEKKKKDMVAKRCAMMLSPARSMAT